MKSWLLSLLIIFPIWFVNSSELPFQLKVPENQITWEKIFEGDRIETKKIFQSRQQSFEPLFTPHVDPYTGNDTIPMKCRLSNLPKPIEGKDKTNSYLILSGYASDRRMLGVCDNLNTLLKVQYQMLHCPLKKALYVIRYFYSDKEPWRKNPVATCL